MGFTPIDPSQLDPIDSAVQTTFRAITPDQLDPLPTTPGRTFAGGLVNIANGLGFNLGDEAIAGGNALIDALLGRASVSDAYDQRLADVRSMGEEFRQQAGGLKHVVDIGSGAFLPVGEGISAAKTLGAKLLESAKLGAGIGGAYGFGGGEGTQNRLVGGGVGAGAGAILSPLITAGIEGGGDIISYFTKAGQSQKAAEILRDAAGPDGVANILDSKTTGEYGPKTFAEIAQTPGAANLESVIKQDQSVGGPILKALTERQATRENSLKDIIPEDTRRLTPDVRGQAIRAEVLPEYQAAEKTMQGSWKGIENQVFDATKAAPSILNAKAELGYPLGFSKDAQKVVDAAVSISENGEILPRGMSVKEYQQIRSAAGEIMAKAAEHGDNKEAALMQTVRESLDKTVENAVKNPSSQLTKDTADKFQTALGTSRNFYQTFDKGLPGAIVQKGENGFRMPESQIPRKIIATPEAAKSFAKAYSGNPDAMMQARAALIEDMTAKGPDTWPKYFTNKRPQFKAIFGEDLPKVAKMIDDLASEQSVGKLNQQATGRGSITSQNLATKMKLDGKLRLMAEWAPVMLGGMAGSGSLVGGGAGAVIGGMIGHGVKKAAAESEQSIKNLVSQGILDSRFAATLLGLPPSKRADAISSILTSQVSRTVGSKSSQSSNLFGSQQLNRLSQSSSNMPSGQRVSPSINAAPTPTPSQAKSQPISGTGYNSQQIKQLVEQQPPLVQAMIKVESARNPRAVSGKGAVGLMQLMPEMARALKVDATNPVENIKGGTAFINYLMQRYPDQRIALAAYNAGEPKVNAAIARARNAGKPINFANIKDYLPREARNYPGLVLANLKQLTV